MNDSLFIQSARVCLHTHTRTQGGSTLASWARGCLTAFPTAPGRPPSIPAPCQLTLYFCYLLFFFFFLIFFCSIIYDLCTSKGLKTLLVPSDPSYEKGSGHDQERLANVASSALFVALVDDEWVQDEAHLRLLALAVQSFQGRTHPRIFIVYDKDLRYKEELTLRAFALSARYVCVK